MNMCKRFMAPLAVLLLATPLAAQDKGFSAHGALSWGTDDLKKVTNNRMGLGLGVAYDGLIGDSSNAFRASATLNSFPGKSVDATGVKTSLTSLQVAADIFLPTPVKSLRFFAGLSANKYSASVSPDAPGATDFVKGVKMGVRTGVDYRINQAWSAEAVLQVTELSTGSQGGLNPSWFQFGARYHF